jgi:hypothetical protein
MKNLTLLTSLVFAFFSNIAISQTEFSDYKVLNISQKTQVEIGEEYTMILLYLDNIGFEGQAKEIESTLNLNEFLKQASLKNTGELRVAVKKDQLLNLANIFNNMGLEIKGDSNIANDKLPKYIDTGKPDIDKANYDIAKQKWINENPEAYQRILATKPKHKVSHTQRLN